MTCARESVAGTIALIVAVSLFSTVEISSKGIQASGARIDPFVLVFVRFFTTGIVLFLFGFSGNTKRLFRLTISDFCVFSLVGLIGIALSISLFHASILFFHNASSSAVVFSANPVFVVLLSPFINKETMTPRKLIAVIFGGIGILCFAFESGSIMGNSLVGMALMIGSAFLFALSICISRRVIASYGPFILMGFASLCGSMMVLPVVFLRSGNIVYGDIMSSWIPIGYIVFFGTVVPYGLYYYGLSRTSAYRASISFFLKPVIATLLAILCLGESMNIFTASGTVVIIGSLVLALVIKSGDGEEGRSGKNAGEKGEERCTSSNALSSP